MFLKQILNFLRNTSVEGRPNKFAEIGLVHLYFVWLTKGYIFIL